MSGVTAGPTTIEVTENVTTITATGDQITIDLTDDVTTIQAYTLAIPTAIPSGIDASAVTVTPYNTITSNYLDGALKELADQNFRGSTTPTTNVEEGDTWYDTANDIFYVYRTINGTLDWYPVLATQVDSRLDGGAF